MKEMQVTVSRDKAYCSNLKNASPIALTEFKLGWFIPVEIKENIRALLFDTGSSFSVSVEDSLPGKNLLANTMSKGMKSIGSHNYAYTEKEKNSLIIPKIVPFTVGKQPYDSIAVLTESTVNSLGMPFCWLFERVVMDFSNDQIYFINPQNDSEFNALSITKDIRLRGGIKSGTDSIFVRKFSNGASYKYVNKNIACEVIPLEKRITRNDSLRCDTTVLGYKFYGTVTLRKSRNEKSGKMQLIRISTKDSVWLPNKEMVRGTYELNL